MDEIHEPALVDPSRRLTDDVVANAMRAPESVVLRRRIDDVWTDVTAAEFLGHIRDTAKGLLAQGIGAGDRVGLMSRTRYEWTVCDYAILFTGAITVPIYETSSASQVEWILSDSGSVAVVLESETHAALLSQVAARLPGLRGTYVMERGDLDLLVTSGQAVSDPDLETLRTSVNPDDVATIIYTSGTTGRPKGCELTHHNLQFEAENIVASAPEVFRQAGASTLLFLPLAHVFGRIIQVACIHSTMSIGHAPDVSRLLDDLSSFRPTFLLAVPRVFEKVFNGARHKAITAGKGSIFDRATSVAIAYSESLDSGGPGLLLRAKHALFDRLVYSRLRSAMGGRVGWAVSGGAPLGPRLGHFFRGMGVTILEGYGLTETAGATTVNRPSALRIGTVGRPFPGASVKIADDGEVLLRGPHVFIGYWADPEATAEIIGADGWLHSGDLGALDGDGYLTITGRKKEILVTAGGKNVAPAALEDRLRAHWLISHSIVVGDAKPFIAALITIDPDSLTAWKALRKKDSEAVIADLVSDPDLLADIQAAVDDANSTVSHAEWIRKFRILSRDWNEADGQLTPSMKLRRAVVMEEFADEVTLLYS